MRFSQAHLIDFFPTYLDIGNPGTSMKAADNIPGIDVVKVNDINVELLAPGKVPGRLTLWTAGAIEALEKEKLFR